jgi:hypothetical protein
VPEKKLPNVKAYASFPNNTRLPWHTKEAKQTLTGDLLTSEKFDRLCS